MTNDEIHFYINSRNGRLNPAEIMYITDAHINPQIDHIVYRGDFWEMWDKYGNYYQFTRS